MPCGGARVRAETHPVTLVNSVNPYRLEGQKTAAFEVCDSLGDAPDILAIPVGQRRQHQRLLDAASRSTARRADQRPPRMVGFQAEGAAPIVLGRAGGEAARPSPRPSASATRRRWDLADGARDESGGLIESVTDDEILDAYRRLQREEGMFCEPSSAASVAGIIKSAAAGQIGPGRAGGRRPHRQRAQGSAHRRGRPRGRGDRGRAVTRVGGTGARLVSR